MARLLFTQQARRQRRVYDLNSRRLLYFSQVIMSIHVDAIVKFACPKFQIK